MEYEELKSLWVNYNSKLDNLEKLNKKLIFETLSQKPQRKLTILKFKAVLSLVFPLALFYILYPDFRIENIDWKFVFGCLLTISVVIYLTFINLKTFSILKSINIGKDNIVESARKINSVKGVYITRYKNSQISMPLLYAGIILTAWNRFNFSTMTIIFLVVLFVVLFLYNPKGSRIHKKAIENLEQEILDLNEYK